jgi:hypothetical protein
MLVCEDICVALLFTGDTCLEVRVVWSSVFSQVRVVWSSVFSQVGVVWSVVPFSGGCCMEWCFLLLNYIFQHYIL